MNNSSDTHISGGDLSLFALVSGLLRHRTALVGVTILVTFLSASVTFVRGHRYTATSRFTPSTAQSGLSGLSAVAAQFGVSAGTAAQGESIDFYAELINSRDLLEETALTEYTIAVRPESGGTIRGTLIDFYEINGPSREVILFRVVEKLRDKMAVRRDLAAGIVTLSIVSPYPELSEKINRCILGLVNEYNLNKRRSQAAAEREFIGKRLQEAQAELMAAEDTLAVFFERNQQFQSSSILQAAAQRLQRRVDLKQQVYLTLAQGFEEARMAEVRDTPVLSIVDNPEGSAVGHRGLVRNTIIGFIAGAVLAFGLALFLEYLQSERLHNPEDYSEFRKLKKSVLPIGRSDHSG